MINVYSDLSFFGMLLFLVAPVFITGVIGKGRYVAGLVSTLIGLVWTFFADVRSLYLIVGYTVWQLVLLIVYTHLLKRCGSHRTALSRIFVVLAILPLVLTKLHPVIPSIWSPGFLGISYLTFRSVQVILEMGDDILERPPILRYVYFLLFFPTLSSGPIDRYRRFREDQDRSMSRGAYLELCADGVIKLALGALYKFVFAILFTYLNKKIPGHHLYTPILYMYGYGLQLFFDFAGYSLMAVGVGAFYGIRVPMNFNKPFLARDINDFWERWHITLSSWFRDYIYNRLLMGFIRRETFKNSRIASRVGFLINMTVMGLWHGVTIHYVVYGIYHGLLLILTDIYKRNKKVKKLRKKTWYRRCEIVVTFNLVFVGFLIFSGRYF